MLQAARAPPCLGELLKAEATMQPVVADSKAAPRPVGPDTDPRPVSAPGFPADSPIACDFCRC